MKKLLSVLLALALALSLAVCAFAAPPTYRDMEAKMSANAAPAAQGLNYELPVVTGLSAVWNGKALVGPWLEPYFSPENVTVTASFEQGEPEELKQWWAEGGGWWWEITSIYDRSAGAVTFYYIDSVLYAAYRDTLANPEEDYDGDALFATLPQTTVSVADDLARLYAESLKPWTALELDKAAPFSLAAEQRKVFTFTPPADGAYCFTVEKVKGGGYYLEFVLASPAFVALSDNYSMIFLVNTSMMAELEAGKTYYLFVSGWSGEAEEFQVGVTQLRKLGGPVAQWVTRYLLFGWAWMPLFTFNGEYLLPKEYFSRSFGVLWEVFQMLLGW